MVFQAGALLLMACSVAIDPVDDWRNLKNVTHSREYSVVSRVGPCVRGQIKVVTDQSIKLSAAQGMPMEVMRSNILRISDDQFTSTRNTIFSGRSSWRDVKEAEARGDEFLKIVTKNGLDFSWKKAAIEDDGIVLGASSISKGDIQSVSYVRYKPLTPQEEHFAHEDVRWLAPRLWFQGLMLGKISVRLYDASLPEDNSTLGCR